nr:YHS domain-containing (seleno)protein [Ruegeria sp. HKCCD8929]
MLSRRSLLAGLALSLVSPAAYADSPLFHAREGMALSGYDTVSYFNGGHPVPGRSDIAVMWKGAVWQFASQGNREAFEANPRAFAPQFGGYCAYAMSKGRLSSTDPEAWEIVAGKLYLVHSPQIQRLWQQDIAGNIAMAEQNWPDALFD